MRTQSYQSASQRMPTRQRGFTLLEVMVALVIFSIGLLGLADLQIKSVDYNNAAYQRSQASFLISDIMDRMRANKDEAISGQYDYQGPSQYLANVNCDGTSASCDGSTMAQADLYEWVQALQQTLPGGQGYIMESGTSPPYLVTVTVQWNSQKTSGSTSQLTIHSEL